ncbi:MAG: hypothetical protein ACK5NE_09450 [Brachymonas sp.]
MALPVINTREDLNALDSTPEHDAFMKMLAGTLWRLGKDDTAQAWVAIEDNSTIVRFGFTRTDFPDAQPPALPEYVPEVVAVPEVVTMRQARLALLGAGLLAQVNTAVANMPGAEGDAARIEWEYAQEVRRGSPLVAALSAAFDWTSAQLDDLFTEGAKL